jgi:hypothetical protein
VVLCVCGWLVCSDPGPEMTEVLGGDPSIKQEKGVHPKFQSCRV